MLTEMLLLEKKVLPTSEMLSLVKKLLASSATNLPNPSIIPNNKSVIAWLSERNNCCQHGLIQTVNRCHILYPNVPNGLVSLWSTCGQLDVETQMVKMVASRRDKNRSRLSVAAGDTQYRQQRNSKHPLLCLKVSNDTQEIVHMQYKGIQGTVCDSTQDNFCCTV